MICQMYYRNIFLTSHIFLENPNSFNEKFKFYIRYFLEVGVENSLDGGWYLNTA